MKLFVRSLGKTLMLIDSDEAICSNGSGCSSCTALCVFAGCKGNVLTTFNGDWVDNDVHSMKGTPLSKLVDVPEDKKLYYRNEYLRRYKLHKFLTLQGVLFFLFDLFWFIVMCVDIALHGGAFEIFMGLFATLIIHIAAPIILWNYLVRNITYRIQ